MKIKIVKCVPYQVCPLCNGIGFVPPNLNLNSGSINTMVTCHVCRQEGIIPMSTLPEKDNTHEQSR